MRKKTRTKLKKYLKIAGIVIGILILIIGTVLLINLSKTPEVSYKDTLVCKNYFCEITIDLNTKQIKRDDKETTFSNEFEVSKEKEELIFSSEEEMKKFFSDSVFDVSFENGVFKIKDKLINYGKNYKAYNIYLLSLHK